MRGLSTGRCPARPRTGGFTGFVCFLCLLFISALSAQQPATIRFAVIGDSGTVGLQPLGSTKSSFTAPGCDVDSQCAWYKISVRSSAKAPIYSQRDYRHKVLVVLELQGGKSAQESMRYLQSEKVLKYEVTVKNPRTGQFETKTYNHEGPISFITTTTEAAIQTDDENRSFSISPDESDEQTSRIGRRVLEEQMAGGTSNRPTDDELRVWQDAQRVLAEQQVRIVFPSWFEDVFKFLPSRPLRVRRDWRRFLVLCEAITFLHQLQRPCEELPDGSIEVTVILADYAMASIVGLDVLYRSLLQIPPNTHTVIKAVREIERETGDGAKYRAIMEKTGMTYAAVYKWAKPALQAGYLYYRPETKKGNVKRLCCSEETVSKKKLCLPWGY